MSVRVVKPAPSPPGANWSTPGFSGGVCQSLCSVAVKGRRRPVGKLHMSKLEVKKGSGAEGMVITGDILFGRNVRDVAEVSVATGTDLRLVSAGVAEEY